MIIIYLTYEKTVYYRPWTVDRGDRNRVTPITTFDGSFTSQQTCLKACLRRVAAVRYFSFHKPKPQRSRSYDTVYEGEKDSGRISQKKVYSHHLCSHRLINLLFYFIIHYLLSI